MVAVISIHPQLVDYLVIVLTPIFDINQRVLQRCPVFADECISLAQSLGGSKNIGIDDLLEQPIEFRIGQLHTIQGLELLPEISHEGVSIVNIITINIF